MRTRARLDEDRGAIAVLYGVLFTFVIAPLLVVSSTSLVRSTTTGELQRAADSGALAGAASMPFGNVQFAINYINATSGGAASVSLSQLGLSYPFTDPLQVACNQTTASTSDSHNVGKSFASSFTCGNPPPATYVAPDFLTDVESCATGMSTYTPVAGQADFSSLLPALMRPGVQESPSWKVTGPMDALLGGSTKVETVTGIARRRFKNMVVIPEATLPVTGTTINLNPYAGDARAFVDTAITGTEQLLAAVPSLGGCSTLLEDERADIDDAAAPQAGGPSANQILADAAASQTPVVVVLVVQSLSVPFLDFVPVCVNSVGGNYVGDPVGFGSCTVMTPGAFRASLRRQ